MKKTFMVSKYLEVFRLSFKMQIVWRFDVAMTILATLGKILAAWILWQAIFQGRDLVKGFSFHAMLSYYIISSIISSINFSDQISGEISELIRNGRFSGHMVTPVNPLGFFGFMTAGETCFHLGFSLAVAILCALLFRINVILTGNVIQMAMAILMVILGLMFMSCYHYFIGILAFKFLDINFFLHVQGSIIAFVTGSMIPLSLLPDSLLFVLRLFPFTHVAYTPAMLLSGQIDLREGLFGLAVIAGWTLAMFAISQFSYIRLRVNHDGVGI